MIAAGDVVVVILAAGLSRRFGTTDKLLAPCHGSPLVTHAGRLALSFPFAGRFAITQDGSEVAKTLASLGLDVRVNAAPEAGIGSSLAIAIGAAQDLNARACLVLLGDMPNVTGEHVQCLLDAYAPLEERVASSDGRRRSPPVLVGQRYFTEFGKLSGDRGGSDILKGAPVVITDASMLSDVDLATDLPAD